MHTKEEKTLLSIALRTDLWSELNKRANLKGLPITDFIERLLIHSVYGDNDPARIPFQRGSVVQIAPQLTQQKEWLVGVIFDIKEEEEGTRILYAQDEEGAIHWGEEKFFRLHDFPSSD